MSMEATVGVARALKWIDAIALASPLVVKISVVFLCSDEHFEFGKYRKKIMCSFLSN